MKSKNYDLTRLTEDKWHHFIGVSFWSRRTFPELLCNQTCSAMTLVMSQSIRWHPQNSHVFSEFVSKIRLRTWSHSKVLHRIRWTCSPRPTSTKRTISGKLRSRHPWDQRPKFETWHGLEPWEKAFQSFQYSVPCESHINPSSTAWHSPSAIRSCEAPAAVDRCIYRHFSGPMWFIR